MRLKIIRSKSQPPADHREEPRDIDSDSVLISSLLKNGKKRPRIKLNNHYNKQKQSSAKVLKIKHTHPTNHEAFPAKTRRRRKPKQKRKTKLDEPSRLQRRSRYFLIKMKLEQNLIDAYSAEGWKGKSREKIKPEEELLRAKKQISKCKLALRDVIRQLDSLSSPGSIDASFIHPDGSVSHEHIFCAKCKMNEVSADNDIVLCDGICNCAFHQNCLDPPLKTENIPPGDQGWLCKFCESRTEIIEAMNAHLGTRFGANVKWEEIFEEEAINPKQILAGEEWPSDDSSDEDFDPHRTLASCSTSSCGDSTTSTSEGEVLFHRRARKDVDYKKLYNDMFGKNDKVSEDEDWGPPKKRRKEKETDDQQLSTTKPLVLSLRREMDNMVGIFEEADLERLWEVENRIEELRKTLLTLRNDKKVEQRVIFAPVAELKEKHL